MQDFQKNIQALKNLKKPQAIIFDWDNTLVNTWPLIQQAINLTMAKMQMELWSLEKVRNTVHKSMRDSFPDIFGERWQEAGEIYRNSYSAINLDQLELLPNALTLLKKAQEKNILQFVVSNKIGSTLRREVKKLAVEKYFFSVIGALDAKADKPSNSPVEMALQGSGIDCKKDQVWFVGDTIADVECAFNSSCSPIIFSDDNNKISSSISQEIISSGYRNSGVIPLYFDHKHLSEML